MSLVVLRPDIPGLKNVLGYTLASDELVAGTGGVNVLNRLSAVESAQTEQGVDLAEVKEVIGFDGVPEDWKTPSGTDDLYQRSEQTKVDVQALQDKAAELSNVVGNVPADWLNGADPTKNLYNKLLALNSDEIKNAIGYSNIPLNWKEDGTENLYSTQLALTEQYAELEAMVNQISADLTVQAGKVPLDASNIYVGAPISGQETFPGINTASSALQLVDSRNNPFNFSTPYIVSGSFGQVIFDLKKEYDIAYITVYGSDRNGFPQNFFVSAFDYNFYSGEPPWTTVAQYFVEGSTQARYTITIPVNQKVKQFLKVLFYTKMGQTATSGYYIRGFAEGDPRSHHALSEGDESGRSDHIPKDSERAHSASRVQRYYE